MKNTVAFYHRVEIELSCLRNKVAALEELLALRGYWDALRKQSGKLPPTIEIIVNTVCRHFGLVPAELRLASRANRIAHARYLVFYLCSKLEDLGATDISRLFNHERSTVAHGIKVIGDRISVDAGVSARVETLKAEISNLKRDAHALVIAHKAA